jgi:hypothetical protein
MVGVTPQIMQQGMRTDYKLVDRLATKRNGENQKRARRLPRTSIGAGLGQDQRADQSALLVEFTAGEVFTTPATVDGTSSVMRRRRFFNGKYGDLQST